MSWGPTWDQSADASELQPHLPGIWGGMGLYFLIYKMGVMDPVLVFAD